MNAEPDYKVTPLLIDYPLKQGLKREFIHADGKPHKSSYWLSIKTRIETFKFGKTTVWLQSSYWLSIKTRIETHNWDVKIE